MLSYTEIEKLFGPGQGSGAQRARVSTARFLVTDDSVRRAEGARPVGAKEISAWELWANYDDVVLRELAESGEARLPRTSGAAVSARLEALGLDQDALERFVKRIGVSPIEAVGLTPDHAARGQFAEDPFAYRLRQARDEQNALSANAVLALAEAGWVVAVQHRLDAWLGADPRGRAMLRRFEPDSQYGGLAQPTYRHGYQLAHRARRLMALDPEAPIESLRRLVEVQLGIPVVQTVLPRRIAGATIKVGTTRGIVLNITGPNENVWVRRATLAHELGHLLWDPDERLRELVVDQHNLLDDDFTRSGFDPVEARANAFAIELLAPHQAVLKAASGLAGGAALRQVMERFGISLTAVRHHLGNARGQDLGFVGDVDPAPTASWMGRESFGVDFFPIRATPKSRVGAFATLVARAHEAGLLSTQSAADWLVAEEDEFLAARDQLLDLHPTPRVKRTERPRVDPPSTEARIASRRWLRENARRFPGQWLALAGDTLVAQADNSQALLEALEQRGIDPRSLLVTPIGSDFAAA